MTHCPCSHDEAELSYIGAGMTTHKITLTFFDHPGNAEGIRMALHHAKVKFEDDRIPFAKWFEGRKETTLGKALPNLHIGNEVFTQSVAILRWACKQNKTAPLYPADDCKALRVDEIIDIIVEVGNKIMPPVLPGNASWPRRRLPACALP